MHRVTWRTICIYTQSPHPSHTAVMVIIIVVIHAIFCDSGGSWCEYFTTFPASLALLCAYCVFEFLPRLFTRSAYWAVIIRL